VSEIAYKFNALCASLIAARREDALVLAQKLAIAEQDQKTAELALRERETKIVEQGALIARYEALLGKTQDNDRPLIE